MLSCSFEFSLQSLQNQNLGRCVPYTYSHAVLVGELMMNRNIQQDRVLASSNKAVIAVLADSTKDVLRNVASFLSSRHMQASLLHRQAALTSADSTTVRTRNSCS